MPPVPPRSFPGVYIEEQPAGVHSIPGVPTSITAFIGHARRGPVESPVAVNSFADFERLFGSLWKESALGFAVRDFFLNGGSEAVIVRLRRSDGGPLRKSDFIGAGKEKANKGLYVLNKADLFNLLCIPGYKDTGLGIDVDKEVISSAARYCEARRAMLLVDSPASWRTKADTKTRIALGVGTTSRNAALFFRACANQTASGTIRRKISGRAAPLPEFLPAPTLSVGSGRLRRDRKPGCSAYPN